MYYDISDKYLTHIEYALRQNYQYYSYDLSVDFYS